MGKRRRENIVLFVFDGLKDWLIALFCLHFLPESGLIQKLFETLACLLLFPKVNNGSFLLHCPLVIKIHRTGKKLQCSGSWTSNLDLAMNLRSQLQWLVEGNLYPSTAQEIPVRCQAMSEFQTYIYLCAISWAELRHLSARQLYWIFLSGYLFCMSFGDLINASPGKKGS